MIPIKPSNCTILKLKLDKDRTNLLARKASKGITKGNGEKYKSDDETKEFESDKRFSNFVLFAGTIALGCIFMASNVLHTRR